MHTGKNSLIVQETGRRWYHVPLSKQSPNTWPRELTLYQVVRSHGWWWAYQEDKEQVIRLFIEEHAEQSPRKRAGTDTEPSQFHKLAAALTVEETWKLPKNSIRWHRWSLKSLGFIHCRRHKWQSVCHRSLSDSQISLLPPTLHQCCPGVQVRDAQPKQPAAPLYSVSPNM